MVYVMIVPTGKNVTTAEVPKRGAIVAETYSATTADTKKETKTLSRPTHYNLVGSNVATCHLNNKYMSVSNKKDLSRHLGHEIECVVYGDGENVALECVDCSEVLLDFDN